MIAALFSSTLTGVSAKTTNRSNLEPIRGLLSAARQIAGTEDKRAWHLIVESRDDIGESAAEFKADLKAAFEDLGDTVVEKASDDSVDLYFYLGKDDADDDNDGTPDAKDVGDANGDGAVNEQDTADLIDLDQEIPEVMDDFADKNKSEGIYIYLQNDLGLALVFVTKADSLKEPETTAKITLPGNIFFQKTSFASSARTSAGRDPIAKEIASNVTQKTRPVFTVSNLPRSPVKYGVSKEELLAEISKYGTVKGFSWEHESNGLMKGTALVSMETLAEAEEAVRKMDGMTIGGMRIQVLGAREVAASTGPKAPNAPSKKAYEGRASRRN